MDKGITWEYSGIDPPHRVVDISTLFSHPSYFFLVINFLGLYQYTIPMENNYKQPFLSIPWDYSSPGELVDKISAYFDHQYPLLEYFYKSEPSSVNNTTLNFAGQEERTPLMYYSSHNGVDFLLHKGTQILAPAEGYVKYYTCLKCGHSIKINHTNGYETTYMHLQKENLITSAPNDNLWVKKGDVLGLVGMSGNTSGPHLHFNVTKDKNNNGLFDDFPDGFVDPFGWQDPYNKDPWANLSWTDILGDHSGTESAYLWTNNIDKIVKTITQDSLVIQLNNKTVTFDSQELDKNAFTAIAYSFIKPLIPYTQFELAYIENTSLSLTLIDHQEEKVFSLDEKITLSVDLTDLSLKDIIVGSLKIYFWNDFVEQWEPLPTIFDQLNNKLIAETDHLSHYAVLGEKIYSIAPESTLEITGELVDGWYVDEPVIQLSAEDFSGLGITTIYYSLNKGLDWETYVNPVTLDSIGIVEILYRAEDGAGNLERTHSHIVKIGSNDQWRSSVKIRDNLFSTN